MKEAMTQNRGPETNMMVLPKQVVLCFTHTANRLMRQGIGSHRTSLSDSSSGLLNTSFSSSQEATKRSNIDKSILKYPEDFKPRLPPPPLRLSWPLVTLRRFGFYGNSLFKVETGRRAPRGEGLYLFRIKNLREFRKSFEICVHQRRDNLSVHHLSNVTSENRSLLRNNHGKLSLFMPLYKIFHKQSSSLSLITTTTPILLDSINEKKMDRTTLNEQFHHHHHKNTIPHHPHPHHPHSRQHFLPVLSERNNLAFSFDDTTDIDLDKPNTKLSIQQQHQHHHHNQATSNCLHWLQLQNTSTNHYDSNENHHHDQNPINKLQHHFKYSCPQLNNIPSMNSISWNDSATNVVSQCHCVNEGGCSQHNGAGAAGGSGGGAGGASHFSVHHHHQHQRSNPHNSHCAADKHTNDDHQDVNVKDECTVKIDEVDEISNLPEAPLPPPLCNNNLSYFDIIIQGKNQYYQRIYDNLITVNHEINDMMNNNNDDEEAGENCCCNSSSSSNRSLTPTTPTTTATTPTLVCSTTTNSHSVTEIIDTMTNVVVVSAEGTNTTSLFNDDGEQLTSITTCTNSPVVLKKSLSSDINLLEMIDNPPNGTISNNTTSITTTDSSTDNNDKNNTGSLKQHDTEIIIRKCKNKSQTLILPRLSSISTSSSSSSSKMYLHSRHASLPNPNTQNLNHGDNDDGIIITGQHELNIDNNHNNTHVIKVMDAEHHSSREEENRTVGVLYNKKTKTMSSDCCLCKIQRNLSSHSSDRKNNADMLDMITEHSPYYNLSTNTQTLTQLQHTGLCTSQTIASSSLPKATNPDYIHSSSVLCLPTAASTSNNSLSTPHHQHHHHATLGDEINCTSCRNVYLKESPIQPSSSSSSSFVSLSMTAISTNIITTTTITTSTTPTPTPTPTTTATTSSLTKSPTTIIPCRTNSLGYHHHHHHHQYIEKPTNILHYATLDFGLISSEITTNHQRNEQQCCSSDMNTMHRKNNNSIITIHDMDNNALIGSSRNQQCYNVVNTTISANTSSSSSTDYYNQTNLTDNYTSRIYGTLTDSLHSHLIGGSGCLNHFTGHIVSTSHNNHNNHNNSNNAAHCDDVIIHDEVDTTDLPSNYVAICQLQTLAMRAVLSATT
ncbi:unnamed protein product [Schistosoma turkestanicum]|nr:unnamed protein product [Schistosoma turkestanicum]